MYSVEQIKKLLESRLTDDRYTHSLNVADKAVELARKYGEDTNKAYLAGLLHDICKNEDKQTLLEMTKKCRFTAEKSEVIVPALHHAVAGAWYCENELGVTDEDILRAVRYHTVARAEMSLLEMIIYLADLTSAERDYPDVENMRRVCGISLELAMLEALRFTLRNVSERKSYLPETSLKAYNYYLGFVKENGLSEEI